MKNILFILALLISFSSFSQSPMTPSQLGMKDKTYKKLVKKLDLKIINRGFDDGGCADLDYANNRVNITTYQINLRSPSHYTKLWSQAFFEMGIGSYSACKYTLEIAHGGFSGQILKDGWKVLTFTTNEKMFLSSDNRKRSAEFIQVTKVVYNEILKTIR